MFPVSFSVNLNGCMSVQRDHSVHGNDFCKGVINGKLQWNMGGHAGNCGAVSSNHSPIMAFFVDVITFSSDPNGGWEK